MFPGSPLALSPRSRPSRILRRRVVRGLDVAVEFATLGEYGVEEVDIEPREPASSCGWDWPPRCHGRGRPAGAVLPRARAGACCPA